MAKSNLRRDFINSHFTVHHEGSQCWNLEAGTERKTKEEQIPTTQDCRLVSGSGSWDRISWCTMTHSGQAAGWEERWQAFLPLPPTPIMGQKGLAPVGRKNLRGRGRTGREGGHFRDLNSIFHCTVFFLEIGLEAELSACLGPDSGLLRNTNRNQQDSKDHKLC